jgi:murein DD-endopeptidase MepM/ murein hydrolase activator NlpD
VFQPTKDAFGSVALSNPARAPRPSFGSRIAAKRLPNLDLVVDLGEGIGSRRWWGGLATLGALLSFAFLVAANPARIPELVQPAFSAAQLRAVQTIAIAPIAFGSATGAVHEPSSRVLALVEPPERPRIEVTARLREIDSFNGALRRAGVSSSDVAAVGKLLAAQIDVRKLKPGTSFDIVLGRRPQKSEPRPLESLAFRAAFDLRLEAHRTEAGDLILTRDEIAVDNTPLRITGDVGPSLYKSARAAGLPGRVVAKYIKAMSPKVDFRRDVAAADSFEMIVEHRRAETGETETGKLLYARLQGRKDIELLRWEHDGQSKFYTPDGVSANGGMIATPVSGARISSTFGRRHHPILGRTRMHTGIDFAARKGTPIHATAPGRVIFAGRAGGYGNQVRVRHKNGIVTSYSHMSRFAAHVGERVSAGETIGYVGSTGLSTGPHLHYEVRVHGRPVNPRSAKLPIQDQLTGRELARFKAELQRMRSMRPVAVSHEA